jgi:hypothetical protein
MTPDPVDLTPLDPSRDQKRWNTLVHRILTAAGPELTRRAAVRSPVVLLARWAWPTLAAAAVIALASVLALANTRQPTTLPAQIQGVADALDVPAPMNAWLVSNHEPTARDVLVLLDGDLR